MIENAAIALSEDAGTADLSGLGEMFAELGAETTEIDPAAQMQKALVSLGRLTNSRPGVSKLMNEGVKLVAQIVGADISGVGLVSGGGKELAFRATYHGNNAGDNRPLAHKYTLEPGRSLAAFALGSKEPVISTDLNEERRFDDIFLRNLGITSALLIPMHLNEEPFGVLGVFGKQDNNFSDEGLTFAETIANLLASAIIREGAEEALKNQHEFVSSVMSMVDSLVLTLDNRFQITSSNKAVHTVSGFTESELQGKSFCNVFLTPGQIDSVQKTLRDSATDKQVRTFISELVPKNGDRRHISWSLRISEDAQGGVKSIQLTGKDRTAELQAKVSLQKFREEAARATKELRDLRAKVSRGTALSASDTKSETKPDTQQKSSQQAAPAKKKPRRSFRCRQAIAPVYGDRPAERKDLFTVDCRDLSANGFSFTTHTKPDFKDLVVELGKAPNLTYFTAKVARITATLITNQTAYHADCQFNVRVKL